MRRSCLGIVGVGLTLVSPCWPNAPARAVEFQYLVPPTCPDSNTAWRELTAYSPLALAPPGSDRFATILLEISATVDGYGGRVSVRLPGQHVERQLSDSRCDALLQALVLVAAIALDPAHRDAAATNQPKNSTILVNRHSFVTRSPRAWSVGLTAGLRSDVAPVVLATPGVYVSHRRTDFGMAGHYYGVLTFGQTKLMRFDLGEAKFTWGAGRFAACPLGGKVARFSYGSCGIAEVGWLTGKGQATAAATTTGGLWLAAGLGLLATVDISALQLAGFGGALVPIVRDRYYFAPDETVHQPSWLGWLAEVQLGLRFGE